MTELVGIGVGLALVFGGLKMKGKEGVATVVIGGALVVTGVVSLAYKLTTRYE